MKNSTISKLKIRRIQLGIKANELANKLGISQMYLYELENEIKKNPSTVLKCAMANELNSTVEELFDDLGKFKEEVSCILKYVQNQGGNEDE